VTDRRIPSARERRRSKARFRCPTCRRWTTATEHGVCPGCGLGPPAPVPEAGAPDPEAWRRARDQARELGIGPGYWIGAAAFAVLVGIGAALLAVC
jgi:hypothetical protein